ncbi:unnamed protein product [Arabidopsis lyrata]|uniref:RNA recognition motif-containing protein n=1 Tax=Arabidopsis lyrata subsp. lyrata TaxID=81972 RepID=D7MT24_ARALL|nr:RNA recognition motif-containing protein [Arabidopsis lyrata subsp. lyrata]CAH8279543.1 unnamed protein product [Arabidopsis lyrata]
MSKQILISFALFQPNDRETKFFVAGLLWITRTESLISYFERFGVIVKANVVCDGVTFREVESATRACENPNHVTDGRTVNCKIAYLGARIHNNQPNQYDF